MIYRLSIYNYCFKIHYKLDGFIIHRILMLKL